MKSAEDIAHLRALFGEGWSKRKIAAALGMSRNTLNRYLRPSPQASAREAVPTTKLAICLAWLQEQPRGSSLSSATLRQMVANERGLHVSVRTLDRARRRLREAGGSDRHGPDPAPAQSVPLDPAGWRIGPYCLSATGDLSLGDARIGMAWAQTLILLIFARKPNQVVSRDEIAQQLWPGQEGKANQRRNVTLAVHRLREVFAMGPLGGAVIRGVYGKGYVLSASVEPIVPAAQPCLSLPSPASGTQMDNPFYLEAHHYWSNRDPYQLPRQEWLLQQTLATNPRFEQGYLELCYFQLLQCFWGMRAAWVVLPSLQRLLDMVDTFPRQPSGWLAIKAEIQSLLLWQPRTSQRHYGTWLGDTLPGGMPRNSWARHLIFSGQPEIAVRLLHQHVRVDLCQGWLNLAMAYCALGDLAAAEEAVHHQLRLDSGMVGTQLFLAVLMASQGKSEQAAGLIQHSGLLDRPFQGVQALTAFALAGGGMSRRSHQLLDQALALTKESVAEVGAIGYWGLAALALGRQEEALQLLKLSVNHRCTSAPVLFRTPFLKPHAHTLAVRLFTEAMRRGFAEPS